MADQPQIIVSTDIVGALGNPNDVLLFWRQAAPKDLFPSIGLEVIAWRYNWPRLSPELKRRIVGFHGRTHTWHEPVGLSLHLANPFISPPVSLLKHAAHLPQSVYVLNHSPIIRHLAATCDLNRLALTHLNQTLVIENDVFPGALTQSLRLSSYFGPRNLVCDLSHLCREVSSPPSPPDWTEVARRFAAVAPFCFTVHLPIGTHPDDSLPLDVPDSFLNSVAQILARHQIVPVLECQWGGSASIFCRPHRDPAKLSHVRRWLTRLDQTGRINT